MRCLRRNGKRKIAASPKRPENFLFFLNRSRLCLCPRLRRDAAACRWSGSRAVYVRSHDDLRRVPAKFTSYTRYCIRTRTEICMRSARHAETCNPRPPSVAFRPRGLRADDGRPPPPLISSLGIIAHIAIATTIYAYFKRRNISRVAAHETNIVLYRIIIIHIIGYTYYVV